MFHLYCSSLGSFDTDALYIQPYWRPEGAKEPCNPVVEFSGPFVGYKVTEVRLPQGGGVEAAKALFAVAEEVTNCKFE